MTRGREEYGYRQRFTLFEVEVVGLDLPHPFVDVKTVLTPLGIADDNRHARTVRAGVTNMEDVTIGVESALSRTVLEVGLRNGAEVVERFFRWRGDSRPTGEQHRTKRGHPRLHERMHQPLPTLRTVSPDCSRPARLHSQFGLPSKPQQTDTPILGKIQSLH